jgi:hypothetical protein
MLYFSEKMKNTAGFLNFCDELFKEWFGKWV